MEKQQILESKILIPDIRKEYEQREKLLSALEREEGKLLVLRTTIGYDKTVLLSQYARLQGHICAWYHLDSMDNEFITFVRYLVRSFSRALEGIGLHEKLCMNADADFSNRPGKSLAKGLVQCMDDMDGKRLVLVLDDFHVLENSEIFKFLEDLLDYIDHRFLLVVGTEGVLPDSFAKYFTHYKDDDDTIGYTPVVKKSSENDDTKPLQVSCFGKFRVVITKTGKEISWRTRKALELFAYLVDLEGKPVERRVLLEQLWPDNAPNNEVAMLHNMIYSIRKELRSRPELNNLIQYKGHQYCLDTSLIEVDLESKKQICKLAEAGNAEKLYEHRETLLKHWGAYLKEVDGTWCMARRTYFERTYGKACTLLAAYCRKRRDFETEASCWSAYMAADRYSEEAVAGLLRCYANMGERHQMQRVFESSQKIFREELGIELDTEIVRIYEQGLKDAKYKH